MANYKAVANGNWSNLATWQDDSSGSFVASTVLPGAADVVYWNNFTVAIDQDVTVLQIRNNSTTGVTAGGGGTVSTSRTINADLFLRTGNLITVSANSPSVVNMTGNMPGTAVAGSNGSVINVTGTATLNFVGTVYSNNNPAGAWTNNVGIRLNSTATLNVTGDVVGGAQTGTSGADINYGIFSFNGATINVVGNVSGGTGNRNYGIFKALNDLITITGNVGGTAGGNSTWMLRSIGTTSNSTIPINIVGNVSSNINHIGIESLTTTPIVINGNIANSPDGMAASISWFTFVESSNMQYQFRKLNLTTNTLYTPGVATGHPATTNVRTGITYGPTNNLTGTCAVPPANTVSLGVPVDNTVGTATLDANALAAALNTSLQASLPAPISASLSASLPTPISASLSASLPTPIATSLNTSLSASLPAAIAPLLWDEDVTNITTPNSIGERLKNCATVATTGAQISSFNP